MGSAADTYAERRHHYEFKCSGHARKADQFLLKAYQPEPSPASSTNSSKTPYVKNSNPSLRIPTTMRSRLMNRFSPLYECTGMHSLLFMCILYCIRFVIHPVFRFRSQNSFFWKDVIQFTLADCSYFYFALHEGKVKSSRPSLRETWDKRPLGRDPGRSVTVTLV